MENITIILYIAAIYIFVYEGILSTSLKSKILGNLFKLQDELEAFRINKNIIDNNEYIFISKMLETNISVILYSKIIPLYKIVLKKNIIQKASNNELKSIYNKCRKNSIYLLLINSGGWFAYLAFLILLIFNN